MKEKIWKKIMQTITIDKEIILKRIEELKNDIQDYEAQRFNLSYNYCQAKIDDAQQEIQFLESLLENKSV